MRRIWISMLSAALIFVSAVSANPRGKKGAAARTAQSNTPIENKPTDTRGLPGGPVMFDGSILTETRAGQIATSAGFTLIDFHRCSTGSNCAIFEVSGPAGRIFQYQVLGERCKRVLSQGTIHPDAFSTGPFNTARKSKRGKQAARTASPENGTVGTTTTPVNQNGPTMVIEGDVSSCFGSYTMAFRARQENTFYADKLGHSIKMAQFYQTVQNGHWLDLFNISASNWKFARENSGIVDKGWAHETRYANGTLRNQAGESYEMIASGGNTGQTPGEMCGGSRDAIVADETVTIQQAYAACKGIPLPGSATLGGELSLEPFGLGGSVNGSITKTSDTCANFRDIALAKTATSGASYYNDCMQHPGRYFPHIFPPEDGALTLDALTTAIKSEFGDNLGVSSTNCPATFVNQNVTVDMGGGKKCTADAVRYTCVTTTGGSCECTPEVEGSITCTEPGAGARKRR